MADNLSSLSFSGPGEELPKESHKIPDFEECLGKDVLHMKYKQIVEKLRRLIDQDEQNSLYYIDIIQRLALDHHFSEEIGVILHQHYASLSHRKCISSNDLHLVSLSFRLLRQAGFPVTQDVFSYFMQENGNMKFKENLSEDTKGLLALYEASHLGFEGEDILEEAAMFSTRSLAGIHSEHQMVKYAVENPYHKSLPQLIAKNFIESNALENEQETMLQELARMDRVMLGSLFQEEVFQVVKWWNELELMRELEFARDQPMKWHMWSMTVVHEPRMSWLRVLLTKPISIVYIVDDIFDIYGTLDQLDLFTQTIKRWEISSETEGLPNYMRMCFNGIQETTQEISNIVYQKHGYYPLHILRRSWEKLFDSFLTEAKWFASGHLAKGDEYLSNGIVSSGVPMVLCNLFFLIGENITSEETQQMLNEDEDCILYLVGMILRLYDDLQNAQEDEQQNGHDGSYVKCYMKENKISSYGVAKEHVMNKVSNAWKKINKCALSPSNPFSPSFTKACLNCARMVPIMYDKGHKLHLRALEERFKSMLKD